MRLNNHSRRCEATQTVSGLRAILQMSLCRSVIGEKRRGDEIETLEFFLNDGEALCLVYFKYSKHNFDE